MPLIDWAKSLYQEIQERQNRDGYFTIVSCKGQWSQEQPMSSSWWHHSFPPSKLGRYFDTSLKFTFDILSDYLFYFSIASWHNKRYKAIHVDGFLYTYTLMKSPWDQGLEYSSDHFRSEQHTSSHLVMTLGMTLPFKRDFISYIHSRL